jgi:heme/copper-type cytochrome/quinol oxidase subunit 2
VTSVPRWIYVAIGLVVASTAVLLLTANAGNLGQRQSVRNITIDARQFAFEPSTLTVNQGDRVRIQVVSGDVTHGFYLDSYDVMTVAQPGRPGTVEFVADRAGTFRFRCSTTCGPLHPFMIGELTILPVSRTNPGPLVGSVALALLAGIATVAWSWRSSVRQEALSG